MRRRNLLTWAVVAVAAVTLSCGGEGPSSPSGTGVEVQGLLLGEGASFVASSGAHPSAAKAEKVVVTVEGTTITTEVSANGTFVLKGIPGGSFTLVFMAEGKEILRITITAADGAEVKVVVKQVESGNLVLVDLKVETPGQAGTPAACVINGGKEGQGIELEGVVAPGDNDFKEFDMTVNGGRASAVVHVITGLDTTYRCIGGAKGDTDDACKALITPGGGAKVHVRGTLTTCSSAEAIVAATEVKIQK